MNVDGACSPMEYLPDLIRGKVPPGLSSNPGVASHGQVLRFSSPIGELAHFHKAILSELDRLYHAALSLEAGTENDIKPMFERSRFLHMVYKYHSHAEDEVILPALDLRVKNVAHAYSLEHEAENELFKQMSRQLTAALESDDKDVRMELLRQLVCTTEALTTTLSQHLIKEEEQVFSLLVQHFSVQEQAALVWQFMCCMPVSLMEEALPWVAACLNPEERQEMALHMHAIVPGEILLRQVVSAWFSKGQSPPDMKVEWARLAEECPVGSYVAERPGPGQLGTASDVAPAALGTTVADEGKGGDHPGEARELGRLAQARSGREQGACVQLVGEAVNGCGSGERHPVNEIIHFHNALRKELEGFAAEARMVEAQGAQATLASLMRRYRFLTEVCRFHSAAEDEVVFRAVGKKAKLPEVYAEYHAAEHQRFHVVGQLLAQARATEAGTDAWTCLVSELCCEVDSMTSGVAQHLADEELEVLPLLQQHFTVEEQRTLMYQSLRVMPLGLLEQVLPWVAALLSEEEARDMLQNMALAAPAVDAALVSLFSGWASRGREASSGGGEESEGEGDEAETVEAVAVHRDSPNDAGGHTTLAVEEWRGPCEGAGEAEADGLEYAAQLPAPQRAATSVCETDSGERRPKRRKQSPAAEETAGTPQDATPVGTALPSKSVGGAQPEGPKKARLPLELATMRASGIGRGGSGHRRNPTVTSGGALPTVDAPLRLLLRRSTATAAEPLARNPIDNIFKFHKAIRKDLEYLDTASMCLVMGCSDEFFRNFHGRFHFLWGIYRAHSNAEDEIVFPALEAKESLHNVSHSYSIDHKQEEQLFKHIGQVLSQLSGLRASGAVTGVLGGSTLGQGHKNRVEKGSKEEPRGGMSNAVGEGSGRELRGGGGDVDGHELDNRAAGGEVGARAVGDATEEYQALVARLRRMCKSVRVSLDKHVSSEEAELWPLFGMHFTVAEQDAIVGRIIGCTGAEVLQAMLPWVTTALSTDEQETMMNGWRQATKNTMFGQWLSAWWKDMAFVTDNPTPETPSEGRAGAIPEAGTPESLAMVAEYLQRTQERDELDEGKPAEEAGSECTEEDGGAQDEQGGAACVAKAGGGAATVRPPSAMADSNGRDGCLGYDEQHSGGGGVDRGAFKPGWESIFRMNERELEAAIRKVSRDSSLEPERKAWLVQNLMTSRWIVAQQKLPIVDAEGGASLPGPDGIRGRYPSYRDKARGLFGCEHYRRNCKVRAACCGHLFTCRFCHDKVSDHSMDRQATMEMMCMTCLEIQPVGQYCATPACNGRTMARYYCGICKFFEDDQTRSIYHCPFCNLCRVGKGLGVDYFHCMTCNACMSMALRTHTCRENGLESNCPICHDFLFTSNTPIKALQCGHFMHSACYQAYTAGNYTCPVCQKSLGDMAVYFGMLDALLAAQVLPDEYRNRQQAILCNDCERKGMAPFHFVYHKCGTCGSYNTRTL